MKNMLRSTYSMVLLAICSFLASCSLEDHVSPEPLRISTDSVMYNNGWDFGVTAHEMGDLPTTEHGILYLAFFRASNDTDYVPRIDHGARIKFDGTLTPGANNFKYTGNAFAGRYFFFYRAYAIKSDGSAAYGEIRNHTF
ncbi:hypothetical protein [Dyadobacter aurulentus]|uniref:hypothetical protein n=1 Tax=Dyadobacter sp. UC 10 TaxID=2605428 RepID=UPI0011F2817F|nr:hypothetical protein [Dyadobacter sp. UC 10]KAA0992476.1 hypothetical protein FXO21_21045 [Dyadobacter sp. UC 10]